jgi:hypothetical protein
MYVTFGKMPASKHKKMKQSTTIKQSIGTRGNSLFQHNPPIEDNESAERQVDHCLHEYFFKMQH